MALSNPEVCAEEGFIAVEVLTQSYVIIQDSSLVIPGTFGPTYIIPFTLSAAIHHMSSIIHCCQRQLLEF